MTQDIKVSVLIPVYGVEKHIEKCVRSLFEQTMQDGIEFIFTDDCTPDRSIEILERVLEDYPNRKKQVKIIHHEKNCGISVTRETCLQAATGEYFIHCDSDDWVEPEMYETLYQKAKETDSIIVGCNYICEYDDHNKEVNQIYTDGSEESVIHILSGDSKLNSYLWSRLINRKYFIDHGFKSPQNISMLDDMVMVVPLHYSTNKVAQVDKALYHYRLTGSGMTSGINIQKVDSALEVVNILKPYSTYSVALKDAYNKAVAHFSQLLITDVQIYDPQRWKKLTKGIPIKLFGSIRHSISPILIRLGFEKLNLLMIKAYRRRHSRPL